MKKLCSLLFIVCTVAACDRPDTFKCGDYSVILNDVSPDVIIAEINGDAMTLNSTVSASGAKYQGILNDTTVTLWSKGSDWILMLNDDIVIDCK